MTLRAATRRAALFAAALVLASCEKPELGEGSKPVGLRLAIETGSSAALEQMECDRLQLYALALWDGAEPYEGNVSARSTWRSDDPGVVDVGDGVTRAAGEIIAVSAGTTQVRAQFLEFAAAIAVTVRPIVETRIRPETAHLAPGSVESFRLEVRANGDTDWTTRDASWLILQPDAAAIADGPRVRALTDANDVPFTLEASVPTCAVTAQRELRVSPVSHLALEYEQPPAQPLPLGLPALIRVLAHFEDSTLEPQNLSGQVEVTFEDTEPDVASHQHYLDGITLEGLEDGKDAQFSIRYSPLDVTLLSARYTFADLDQESLYVDPAQLTVQYPDVVQLHAWGRFSDGIERRVTRDVTWESSDSQVVGVSDSTDSAGELTVLRDVDQIVQIEVFGTVDEKTVTAESDVRIVRAGD